MWNPDVLYNDVWHSSDGVSWTSATLSAPWSPRAGHASLVHDGKMWIIGASDVWCSSDGASWTLATDSPPWWADRYELEGHSAVTYGGRMWILGGFYDIWPVGGYTVDNVWCSRDGMTWALVTGDAPWPSRYGHASVVYDGRIWVIGGAEFYDSRYNPYYRQLNDVWYSADPAGAERWRLYR